MAANRKPLSFDVERSPPSPTELVNQNQAPAATKPAAQPRQQVGARVTAATYRQLKARAALQGIAVGILVEQAITEFLASHPD